MPPANPDFKRPPGYVKPAITNSSFIGPLQVQPVTNVVAVVKLTDTNTSWMEVIWASDDGGKTWYHFYVYDISAGTTNDMLIVTNPPLFRLYEATIEPKNISWKQSLKH